MNNLYNLLSKEDKKELPIKKYPKGYNVFNENEIIEYVGLINKGEVSIESYSFEGKLMVYNIIKENMMFGNNLIFSSSPVLKGNIVCKTDIEIILINKNKLTKILQNNKEFLIEYLKQTSDFSKNLNYRIKLLTLESPKERLLYHLEAHRDEINFKTITSLSNELNVSREALSRTITKLVNEGIIKKNKNKIKLV